MRKKLESKQCSVCGSRGEVTEDVGDSTQWVILHCGDCGGTWYRNWKPEDAPRKVRHDALEREMLRDQDRDLRSTAPEAPDDPS